MHRGRGRLLAVTATLAGLLGVACAPQNPAHGDEARAWAERVSGPSPKPLQASVRPGRGDPSPLVNPDQIISGGPPPDGIPPIDSPRFAEVPEVDHLDPREPVISLEVHGDARAYPVQILIWHEIVNDIVGTVPVMVTYCPLCNTGIAFVRPVVRGSLLDFGTSGKLYNSNLVMYDRQTGSLWPQVLGQAVVGPLTGTRLKFLPVQLVSWSDWRAAYPQGKVLSLDTGFGRDYGKNPYERYDEPGSYPFFFNGDIDPRLDGKARVVGVRVGSESMAFPYDRLRRHAVRGWAVVRASVGGRPVVVFWNQGTVSAVDAPVISSSRDVGATGVFDPRVVGRTLTFRAAAPGILDDQTGSRWDVFGRAVRGLLQGQHLDRVTSVESFWFDWAAFHPNTKIFQG